MKHWLSKTRIGCLFSVLIWLSSCRSTTGSSTISGDSPTSSSCNNQVINRLDGTNTYYKYIATTRTDITQQVGKIDGCFYSNEDDAKRDVFITCNQGGGGATCDSDSTWQLITQSFTFQVQNGGDCPHPAVSAPARGGCYQATCGYFNYQCDKYGSKDDCTFTASSGCGWAQPPAQSHDWNKISWDYKGTNADQISVGGDVLVAMRNGVASRLTGNVWKDFPGHLSSVETGGQNKIVALGLRNEYYVWNGTDWAFQNATLGQVSVANDGTTVGKGVGNDNRPFIFRNSAWTVLPGQLAEVVAGSVNEIWAVGLLGETYRWNGTGWEYMNAHLSHVSVGSDGTVLGTGLKGDNRIFVHLGNKIWIPLEGQLKQVSVNNRLDIWALGLAGELYKLRFL